MMTFKFCLVKKVWSSTSYSLLTVILKLLLLLYIFGNKLKIPLYKVAVALWLMSLKRPWKKRGRRNAKFRRWWEENPVYRVKAPHTVWTGKNLGDQVGSFETAVHMPYRTGFRSGRRGIYRSTNLTPQTESVKLDVMLVLNGTFLVIVFSWRVVQRKWQVCRQCDRADKSDLLKTFLRQFSLIFE